MVSLDIRPITLADITDITAIDKEVQSVPWSYNVFLKALSSHAIGKVIELDSVVVGFYVCTESRTDLHLANLSVKEALQKVGLGTSLLEDVIAYGKEEGFETVSLNVNERNTRAISLYHKHGFVKVGRQRCYYFMGEDIQEQHALNYTKTLREN